jgi:hypothetical protein
MTMIYPPKPGTILLVGCASSKAPTTVAAKDLYVSDLFTMRRKYAETMGLDWYIISAKHGLLRPDDVISPYDETLIDASEIERSMWGLRVSHQILDAIKSKNKTGFDVKAVSIEIQAGKKYAEPLKNFLAMCGIRAISTPLDGLGIGQQKSYAKELCRRAESDRHRA